MREDGQKRGAVTGGSADEREVFAGYQRRQTVQTESGHDQDRQRDEQPDHGTSHGVHIAQYRRFGVCPPPVAVDYDLTRSRMRPLYPCHP